ncbi:hypothetical protein FOL47_007850 [Perkinsus chesapeaki]|uniref:Uncharacterized protein n=1 Tax=Perkinsus chesapeaki TaxID=330153 RepID=A0A7J6MUU9_PERCH|nr:hypothetical protein FOL47_007850 [Perkinsus chesapeaki]
MPSLNEVVEDMKRRATVEARLRDAASIHDKLRLEVVDCHDELSTQVNRRSTINRYWRDRYRKLEEELIDYRNNAESVKLENCLLKEDNEKLNLEMDKLRSELSLETKNACEDEQADGSIVFMLISTSRLSLSVFMSSALEADGYSTIDEASRRERDACQSKEVIENVAEDPSQDLVVESNGDPPKACCGTEMRADDALTLTIRTTASLMRLALERDKTLKTVCLCFGSNLHSESPLVEHAIQIAVCSASPASAGALPDCINAVCYTRFCSHIALFRSCSLQRDPLHDQIALGVEGASKDSWLEMYELNFTFISVDVLPTSAAVHELLKAFIGNLLIALP